MTLIARCKKCRQFIRFYVWAITDRVALAKKKGERFSLECKCGHSNSYHVNEIAADTNKIIALFSSAIFLLGTPYVSYKVMKLIGWNYYPHAVSALLGVAFIPFLIYWSINVTQQRRQSRFNRHKISEHKIIKEKRKLRKASVRRS